LICIEQNQSFDKTIVFHNEGDPVGHNMLLPKTTSSMYDRFGMLKLHPIINKNLYEIEILTNILGGICL